jgi:hypothetical protein
MMQMESRKLVIGDLVQIDPATPDCFFGGAVMVVTEPKSWGAQGYFMMPKSRGEALGLYFFRARWDQMEWVGHVVWIRGEEPDEEEAES